MHFGSIHPGEIFKISNCLSGFYSVTLCNFCSIKGRFIWEIWDDPIKFKTLQLGKENDSIQIKYSFTGNIKSQFNQIKFITGFS